jgi:hypothetical protein
MLTVNSFPLSRDLTDDDIESSYGISPDWSLSRRCSTLLYFCRQFYCLFDKQLKLTQPIMGNCCLEKASKKVQYVIISLLS